MSNHTGRLINPCKNELDKISNTNLEITQSKSAEKFQSNITDFYLSISKKVLENATSFVLQHT